MSSLKELTINVLKVTTNFVMDIRNESEKSRQQDDDNNFVAEISDDKEAKHSTRSSDFKGSLRQARKILQNRNIVSKNRFEKSREHSMMKSFNLIKEVGISESNKRMLEKREIESFSEIKPHRRKQWSTANMASEAEDSKKPPRKRWSKDTSVIQLLETSDGPSMIDDSCKPVPAPRSSLRQNIFFFDNPVFVSENEEILRIETDYKRENTKIEIRRMSDQLNLEENVEEDEMVDIFSSKHSSKKNSSKEIRGDEYFTNSDASSSKARSIESKKINSRKLNSSPSLGKVTNTRSNSITSMEMSMREKKKKPSTMQDQSFRRKKQLLFKKRSSYSDEVSSAMDNTKPITDIETDMKISKKKQKKKKLQKEEKKKEEIKYISITIHRADVLEIDYMNAKQPMVKVHIVEACTGNYLKTTTNTQENGSIFLQPMITAKFDFKENKSMIPVWEEELIFKHNFNNIMKCKEDVVILFEVIDLLNFDEASFCYDKFGKYSYIAVTLYEICYKNNESINYSNIKY